MNEEFCLPARPLMWDNFTPDMRAKWTRLRETKCRTSKNGKLLEFGGCLFRLINIRDPNKLGLCRVSWRCWYKACGARAKSYRHAIDLGAENDIEIVQNKPHTVSDGDDNCTQIEDHTLLWTKAKWLINEIYMERSLGLFQACRKVMCLLRSYDPNSITYFPLDSFKQSIKRNRQNNLPHVIAPNMDEHFDLPVEFRTTIQGDHFLLGNIRYNMGNNVIARIMVFGTVDFFANCCLLLRIFVDGTFELTPKPFYQLFTLHGYVGKSLIPFLYVFLTHKTEEIYRVFFQWFKVFATEMGVTIDWDTITTDFESGLLPAISKEFPLVLLCGCYFHFTQALLKNIRKLGLMEVYDTNYGDFVYQFFISFILFTFVILIIRPF
jgi:hypothetical protein